MSNEPPPPYPGVPAYNAKYGEPMPYGSDQSAYPVPPTVPYPQAGYPAAAPSSYHPGHVATVYSMGSQQQGFGPQGFVTPGTGIASGHQQLIVSGAPGTTTIVVTQPALGSHSVHMTCPKCRAQILTETTATAGTLSWLICILCIVFGCWLGCCLIPFCVNECQDVEHRCPNCKAYLGAYRRI